MLPLACKIDLAKACDGLQRGAQPLDLSVCLSKVIDYEATTDLHRQKFRASERDVLAKVL
jgi:hypothetical protein